MEANPRVCMMKLMEIRNQLPLQQNDLIAFDFAIAMIQRFCHQEQPIILKVGNSKKYFCKRCNQPIGSSDQFCKFCGQRILQKVERIK